MTPQEQRAYEAGYTTGFMDASVKLYEQRSVSDVEPVAWIPIEQLYPQAKSIDILMGDGSILCEVLPQFDGDLWWEGSGTGEKFIDPKYANVTHWRIHGEHTAPPTQCKHCSQRSKDEL